MNPIEEQKLEKLAMDFPVWSDHLADFRESHPDMAPKDVMRKAGFTYRMRKGKLFHAYWDPTVESVVEKIISSHRGETA